MARPAIRPRFELVVRGDPDEVAQRIAAGLRADGAPVVGAVRGRHAQLQLPEERRRFWSPFLNLEVVDAPEGAAVQGLFMPRPGVWTGYLGGYAAVVTTLLVGLSWAYSQWTLDEPPTVALGICVGCVIVGILLYASAFVGQGLTQGEMDLLRDWLEERTRETVDPAAEASSAAAPRGEVAAASG